jgi:hypothetical protein
MRFVINWELGAGLSVCHICISNSKLYNRSHGCLQFLLEVVFQDSIYFPLSFCLWLLNVVTDILFVHTKLLKTLICIGECM